LLAHQATLDHEHIEELLRQLEAALGQADLLPLYRRLRSQAEA
jgi:hypothetical protein